MHNPVFYLFLFCVVSAMIDTDDVPTIVWWTRLLYPHFTDVSTLTCDNSFCEVTKRVPPNSKKGFVAYMFYGTEFDPEDLPLPRRKRHIWTLLHEESPMNNFIFSHSVGIRLFNYTSTFSRHSDYPLTLQFLPTLEYLTERAPLAIKIKNSLRDGGLAPVIYVQSHCNTASDRDRYVQELMKYIAIDSYGSCLHNKDMPNNLNSTSMYDSETFLDFIARYKFHIAFENAICDDYMTEKLFRPLHVGSVPIYFGSAHVKDWDPYPLLESIIVTSDFKDPQELASYLMKLDNDDTEYLKYLEFKNSIDNKLLVRTLSEREWGINDYQKRDFINGFECFVCDELTRLRKLKRKEIKPKIATRHHMNCHQPQPSVQTGAVLPPNDEWVKQEWPEAFWFGLDQGKALKKMLENKANSSSVFFSYLLDMKYNY